jgi:hypothetical protein
MSHYSAPKRFAYSLFGGSAIWLGTTFCSPLAAYELSLPPISASAPDAMAVPEPTIQPSIVPAASLETEVPTCWDNGPVLEDSFCVNDYACENEYYDDYAYDGYEMDAAENNETTVVESSDADGLVDTPEQSVYSDLESGWEGSGCDYDEMYVYDYGDECQYYHDEYESGSQSVEEERVADINDETSAEEAWAEEYDYDTCEYDYDSSEYDYDNHDDGMEDADEVEAVTEESVHGIDESYEACDYVDPMEHFVYEYDMPADCMEMGAEEEVEIDLFARQPAELLQDADLDLIRSLEGLSDESATLRRARLNEYIEALGFEAIDFAYRYEDTAHADVLTLADDLPGVAAFLASYRLVEQNKIAIDEAVVLLESALSELSLDWIENVGRMTAVSEPAVSVSHPVVDAIAAAGTNSLSGFNALVSAVSQRLAKLPWAELSGRLREIRSAFRPLGSDDGLRF